MKRSKPGNVRILQVLAMMLVASPLVAQTAAAPKAMSDAALCELIQSRLKQTEELRDLDDAAKAKIRESYRQALQEMESAKTWAATADQFEKAATQAPEEVRQTKSELDALPAQWTSAPSDEDALAQIEQAIARREAELEQGRTQLAAVESDLSARASRRAGIPKHLSEARERLAAVNSDLKAPPGGGEIPPQESARQMMLTARQRAVEQEIRAFELELRAHEARGELLPLRRDLIARRIALAEQQIKQWQEVVNRRRQQEAEIQARRAAREAAQADPDVRRLMEKNAALAEMRKALASKIVDATNQLEQVSHELGKLKEQFKRVQEKVKTVGLTNVIGVILRKQRDALPNLRAHRRNIIALQQAIGEGQLAQLQFRDDRFALSDLDVQVEAVLSSLGAADRRGNREELGTAIREALKTESDYLDAIIADHETYYDKLVKLRDAQQELIGETERFSRYIDERVLWIGSASLLKPSDLHEAGRAFWWLAGPEAWRSAGQTLLGDAWRNLPVWTVTLGLLGFLIAWRRRLRRHAQHIGEKAARGSCYRFWPTVESLVLTLAASAVWPGVLLFLGWRLGAGSDASELCKALGSGLQVSASIYFALELLRTTCCSQGLGEAHFGWPASAIRLVRQNVRWFSLFALPLAFVAAAIGNQDNDRWDNSLGRFCFVVGLLCFAVFVQRILRPAGAVFQAVVAARRGSWLERFRYLWYPLCVLTPITLGVLAVAGYYYTVHQLAARVVATAYLVVGAILLRAVLLRWILVNKRKLAIEQARLRRAAQNEAAANDDFAHTAEVLAAATPERDLATINAQTRRLVEYGLVISAALALWCAWIDVLPALGILNRVVVWETTVATTEKVASNDGKTEPAVIERPVAITMADLGLAIVILATSVIAAKNIPGLLEMAVLQHMPLDAGVRYAVATVSRYAITILGLVLCFGAIGIGWSKVQWLVAAMSLGLGFGLQEIFANFVSGLIILFERPVRVGDVVTIADVSGVVSRIRIRATTITDWDRKELIIPNKEFITGRVLNWTLSDPVNRVVVRVGVAYGSDTQLTADLLLQTAKKHPLILSDPPPRVMLEGFGDSSLNFLLTCFLPNLENRITVIHELHMAIDREFREAGVEIAFPQHDIHVRSIDIPLPGLSSAKTETPSWPSVVKSASTDKVA